MPLQQLWFLLANAWIIIRKCLRRFPITHLTLGYVCMLGRA